MRVSTVFVISLLFCISEPGKSALKLESTLKPPRADIQIEPVNEKVLEKVKEGSIAKSVCSLTLTRNRMDLNEKKSSDEMITILKIGKNRGY